MSLLQHKEVVSFSQARKMQSLLPDIMQRLQDAHRDISVKTLVVLRNILSYMDGQKAKRIAVQLAEELLPRFDDVRLEGGLVALSVCPWVCVRGHGCCVSLSREIQKVPSGGRGRQRSGSLSCCCQTALNLQQPRQRPVPSSDLLPRWGTVVPEEDEASQWKRPSRAWFLEPMLRPRLPSFLPQEASQVRELSILLFKDLLEIVAGKSDRRMKQQVQRSLLPLFFRMSDRIQSVAQVRISNLSHGLGRAMLTVLGWA